MINFLSFYDDFKADDYDNLSAANVAQLNSVTVADKLAEKLNPLGAPKDVVVFARIYKNGDAANRLDLPPVIMTSASSSGVASAYKTVLEAGLTELYGGTVPDRLTIIIDITIEED